MRRKPSVAVLGAGIMGSATAIHLARLGARVTLFDRESEPFTGASRWNEGKIHLGFLYAADPTLDSARSVLEGGLDFAGQVDRLTGVSVAERTTSADDLYLVHRDSVTAPDAMADYVQRLASLIRERPDARHYLTDVSGCPVERLGAGELAALADPATVVAGFRVPERSVETNFVADAFVEALTREDRIDLVCGETVTAVTDAGGGGRWLVEAEGGRHGPFDAVVNALWEGRPAIDRTVRHRPDTAGQHRYRVSLFVRTERRVAAPSAVVTVGPFGDVKSYSDRDFYVSWYEAGLLARAEAVESPPVPELGAEDRERIAAGAFAGLGAILPTVREIERAAGEVRVEGGWVYSQGRGRLDDPAAAVHCRSRHGISRHRTYFSVDTGKYSVAPTRAQELARMVVAET